MEKLGDMRICSKCGETIEDQFDSCWKCAAQPELPCQKTKLSARARRALGSGIAFEVLLILLVTLLPRDSWLLAKVLNFLILSHYPVLLLLEGLNPDSAPLAVLLMFLFALVMAVVWAIIIYWSAELVTRGRERLRIPKRQTLLIAYSSGFVCVALATWAIVDASQGGPIPFTASDEVKSAVEGNAAFALDLYQKLKEEPGNRFFSPYSISSSLAMIYAGARGRTEMEIAKAIHFNLAQDSLHNAFGQLIERTRSVQRWHRITLTTGNSLWCQKGDSFTDAFLNLAHSRYHADARLADFAHSPDVASEKINHWVQRETKGRINAIMDPRQLTSDTSLVLCNVIYFKGRWAVEFKPKDTKPAPFFVAKDQTVTVPMMYQSSDFKTAAIENPAMELLELPYYGGDLSMIILLPQAVDGLPDLEKELNAENLYSWLAALARANPNKTSVHIPRFTTTQSFNLVPMLKSLGMSSAFSRASDFSGIDGTKNLFISDVIHKAFVEVNEAGTEAAAGTLFQAKTRSMAHRFTADHPFIFVIRENGSGSILFLGRIVDPTR